MPIYFEIAEWILLILQIPILLCVGYLIVLVIAAWANRNSFEKIENDPLKRFAFLIPAHNEEFVLPHLLESILQLEYPSSNYDIHVIADNCSDETARVATSYGAQAHIRYNQSLIGKGYALEWGLNEIRAAGQTYDAYIIVDADSTVSQNFLQVMQRLTNRGAKVIQAYYGVKDPGLSWNISLRYAALSVLHFLRPRGRMFLGGSAGLKGNGMLFTQDLLDQYPWPASGTEDIEYHMILLLNGHAVKFAPDAAVWGEMPVRFDQSKSQLDRWEGGRLEMARKYIPALLKAAGRAFARRDLHWTYCYIDAVMEHLIPPFSILFGSSILLLLVNLLMLLGTGAAKSPSLNPLAWLNTVLGFSLLAGQIIYLLAGLKMVNAPAIIYRQMVYVPLFVFQKMGQYFRILTGAKPDHWIKTTRN